MHYNDGRDRSDVKMMLCTYAVPLILIFVGAYKFQALGPVYPWMPWNPEDALNCSVVGLLGVMLVKRFFGRTFGQVLWSALN